MPAIAQDWLVAEAGSEWVTVELGRLLPTAPVHTSFFRRGIFGDALLPSRVRTWPLQRVPGAMDRYRALLPLYPAWFTMLDLRGHPLVISSSVAFAHAVRTDRRALHISYVHTPLRYAWDLDNYMDQSSLSPVARLGSRLLRPLLQRWDRATAGRPDILIANSRETASRIRRFWGREAEVIHPPVDLSEISRSDRDDGFLLTAARLIGYRRIDLAVQAANRLQRRLIVVGDGPERGRLESIAGPSVEFRGRIKRAELLGLFARCSAYVVPGIEDFGIAPIEAMAAGKPVIGMGRGGVAETVVDGMTGVHFAEQTIGSLTSAIERLDGLAIDPAACRDRAEGFAAPIFRSRMREVFARAGVDPHLYAGD